MRVASPLSTIQPTRQRLEFRGVVKNAVVDFVGHQQQIVPAGDRHQFFQQVARIRGAGRIVRIDDHQRARAWGDQRFDLLRIRQEIIFGAAVVVHRLAVVENGRGAPQRIVGTGQQHFVAGIEQCAQSDVDQLADAIADEDAFGCRVRGVSRLVVRA
jgi:hypothetical protein